MIDYKKIIRSESLRHRILQLLRFVPDKTMLRLQYRVKTGRRLHLDNPRRYSEKLQWYKLYYRNEQMSLCADKWEVRKYVAEKGLAHILNECYGVWDRAEEFDWDAMPERFVIKDTLGAGGKYMIFVYDKATVDRSACVSQMRSWTEMSYQKKHAGREWVYENGKHRIIAEKLLIRDKNGDLPDYKFFCFDGRVYCSYKMINYTQCHENGVLGFFDRDFRLMKATRTDYAPMTVQPEKPEHYDEMVKMAEILAEGFPHVRVDFYNINGTILFGEMTFFTASGYMLFDPDEFDYTLGRQFVLPGRTVGLH